jgi:predicted porin
MAAATPGAVFAQSSVSFYGRLDISVNMQRFSGTSTTPAARISTIASDTSMFGFRGTEDLGNGMRAYFKLESGVNVDTGNTTSATQFFNREAYVGLADAKLGAVQLGSQFAPEIFYSGRVDPFARFNEGGHPTLLQGAPRGYNAITNNSVQYLTPRWGGFVGRVMWMAPEGSASRQVNGGVEYESGPLYAALAASTFRVTGAAVSRPTVSMVEAKLLSLGATYAFSRLKVHGWYQTNRVDGTPNVDGWLVGVTVPVGAGEIRASYTRRDASGANAALASVGYFHNLSKRTILYTTVARLNNDDTARFGMLPDRTTPQSFGLPGAGQDVTGFQMGIRHFF